MFKNDLYHFAAVDPRNQKQGESPSKVEKKNTRVKHNKGDADKKAKDLREKQKKEEQASIPEEEYQSMLKLFGKKTDEEKKTQDIQKKQSAKKQQEEEILANKEQTQKPELNLEQMKRQTIKKIEQSKKRQVFATKARAPRSTLVVKEEQKTAEKNQAERNKQAFVLNKGFKKLELQVKKAARQADFQVEKRQLEEEGQENGEKNEKAGDQADSQEVEEGQEGDKGESKKKTRRIKKGGRNYVSYDPKRKYRDRFIGAINTYQRKYNRNGRLKFKYRQPSELTFQNGQIQNTYVSSLSRALTVTVNIEEDEDEEGFIQENKFPVVPLDHSKEALTQYLQEAFGFQCFKEGQYETIRHILDGESIAFISETASGKSLTYIMSSLIMEGLSIVVSPLVSLLLDQLAHLPENLPAACISSLLTWDQKLKIIRMVKEGAVRLLFVTPQTLQTEFIYHLQDFPKVNFVCVDEAHSLSELSHNFRTAFLGLGQILLKHVNYRHGRPTILALTATANPETVDSIKDRLKIPNEIRSSTCVNKNLFVTISRERGNSKYEALIRYLNEPQINKCRGILVYCRTKKIMFEAFNYITNTTSYSTKIYHSQLQTKQKIQTLTKFRAGQIKIVVATIALGMGLDFSHLECVIHINMPKSIENYVQEIGRAGRRDRRAYCHLFLDDDDFITERNYIIADQIEPNTLLALYKKLRENSQVKKVKAENAMRREEQEDLVVRRAELMIQHTRLREVINEEEDQEDEQVPTVTLPSSLLKSQLFYIRIDQLVGSTQLRQEALLTLLLKIQGLTKNSDERLRVLPASSQLIKIGFFKNNQEEILRQEPFFQQLTKDCKRVKGTIYVNLIQKCNNFNMRPIQLLTNLYRISTLYTVSVRLETPIYVWQFQGKHKFTEEDPIEQMVTRGFNVLSSEEQVNAVLNSINKIQYGSQVKLNTLYTLARLHARNKMGNILDKNLLIPPETPIPSTSIVKKFDEYFRSNLAEFYNSLTSNGDEVYIPTYMVQESDKDEIYDAIIMFFKNEVNEGELYSKYDKDIEKKRVFVKYQDGKILTRILMGVNTGEVTWKIYGERKYWMLFKNRNYAELLSVVRQLLQKYKIINKIGF